MESDEAIRFERRGRKRRIKNSCDSIFVNCQAEPETKKRAVRQTLVSRYVKKEFDGSGVFLGKITSYDTGLYRVNYEDGDFEDMEGSELRKHLIRDGQFIGDLLERKNKLDESLSKKCAKKKNKDTAKMNAIELEDVRERVGATSSSEVSHSPVQKNDGYQVDVSIGFFSEPLKNARQTNLDIFAETHLVPPPQLPPSSGNIFVPEEYVSHVFSIYTFLRSFSNRLFLSPFGLDDFVGSLNCIVPNTLLDAIHFSLMRALRRHLEMLSSTGSELTSKCLSSIDWRLLDILTWPVYLVHYLTAMRYAEGPEWKGFYSNVLNKEYYNLPTGIKLLILQILCDDVLDSPEIRAEIDMREESEVGVDSDECSTNHHETGPRRMHPRYSKTSASMDQKSIKITSENQKTLSSNSCSLSDVESDENGDECFLCGMDGTLICCDGCPSTYHSRCIGVSKTFIPEGPWFCPECTFEKLGPPIASGTSLRSARVFGIDSYHQVFLCTCDHLVVLNDSVKEQSCLRYYNQRDVPKLLQTLYSFDHHRDLYSGICRAILQYWKIPENTTFPTEIADCLLNSENKKDEKSTAVLFPHGEETHALHNSESNMENAVPFFPQTLVSLTDVNNLQQSGHTNMEQTTSTVHHGQSKMESSISTSHHTCPSGLTNQRMVDQSSAIDFVSSRNKIVANKGHANGIIVSENMCPEIQESDIQIDGKGSRTSVDDHLFMGSVFKPQAYVNQYIHGDFAASAAANLAVLSSEEYRVSESHASENPGKFLSADILLQIKAFSSAASPFFWPNSDKKLVELPREKCCWCLSCKAPHSSKRACLLNSAAMGAIKSVMKIMVSVRPIKNGEGSLPAIAMYILYIAENLYGLMFGPFLTLSFRKHWQMRVEQATTCRTLKALLLELEENIQIIALAGEWVKLVGNCLVESSAAHNTTCTLGSSQRRGPGRRPKKQFMASEISDVKCNDKHVNYTWWRGGTISKLIFRKAILPHKMVKKSALQGGTRKIPGIYYTEGSDIPKISRQTVWRAEVELSQTASQLAFQVRYLDLHIRWGDLARPEQNLLDGKGPDVEASAFRNAYIFSKNIMNNKVRYGVAFANQKHLPSRIMKNVIEVGHIQDGKDIYWFFETRIPLYLIKEYEGRADKVLLPCDGKPSDILFTVQRRQLKASRKDIFSYLMLKRDNLDKCSCACCQLDVLLRDSVNCSVCQGYCHVECTMTSLGHADKEMVTCTHCRPAIVINRDENIKESPLPMQVREYQTVATSTLGSSKTSFNQPIDISSAKKVLVPYSKPLNTSSAKKMTPNSSLASRKRICSWGLIWKKRKENEGDGFDFRLKHLILKGNPEMSGQKPDCHLCRQKYDKDLMYIHCEMCNKWYHADAVELKESQIFDLLGFKCCKCRRIRSPLCPYMDPASIKPEIIRTRPRQSKANSGDDFVTESISDQLKDWEPSSSILRDEFEQFLDSKAKFECNTPCVSGPQKLQVRRQVKHENNTSLTQPIKPIETRGTSENTSIMELDASIECEDFSFEDMPFEPQTYFSFTELLSADDNCQLDTVNLSTILSGENMVEPKIVEISDDILNDYSLAASNVQNPDASIPVQPEAYCWICSKNEPTPDRCCQICEMFAHVACSPLAEFSSSKDEWLCGNCREWR